MTGLYWVVVFPGGEKGGEPELRCVEVQQEVEAQQGQEEDSPHLFVLPSFFYMNSMYVYEERRV